MVDNVLFHNIFILKIHYRKREINKQMMLVTREEADYIRKHSDHIRIATTCKKKKGNRKKQYCEEGSHTQKLLEQYREELRQSELPTTNVVGI